MGTTVFLSHAAKDGDIARRLLAHAKTLDIDAYMYEDDPQPGSELAKKLEDRLRSSHAVMVLLTAGSQHRPSLHAEVGMARVLGKPIIPVIEKGVDASQFVFLQGLEWVAIDLENTDEALLSLERGLRRIQNLVRDNAVAVVAIVAVLVALIYVLSKSES